MEVVFRHAAAEDLERIVATYNSTIPARLATADLEPVAVSSKKAWFDSHSPDTRPLWLVFSGDEYAGWMSFSSFYGRPAYSGTVELSIYLEEAFRGKGIGRLCLAKAIAAAPGCGVHTLLGFIFAHNEPSIRLFEHAGFERWAHLPAVADMGGVLRDLLIFGKKTR